jgi:hypothetical protein
VKKLKLLVSAAVAVAMLALPGAALAKSRDRDHDKLPDRWEHAHHLSTSKKNAKADPDKDGLSNLGELRSHCDPRDADSDNDGTEDGDEDRDGDHVDNANEVREHTSPTDRDTDNDGRGDGREDRDRDHLNNRGEDETANDPTDPDSDDDGVRDGDEVAGTIASDVNPTTGELTINLANGQSVTAVVNDATRIECETEDEHEDGEGHHGNHAEPGDDNGGSTTAARHGADDDNSGPGRSGDDEGDDNSGPGSRHEHDGDDDDVCTTADLTAGTVVHEAKLDTSGDPDVWTKLELLK